MGITGSDVAKDAADMILLSDDFSARAIGKRNIRKYTKYIIVAAIALLIIAAYFKPR